jgi:hypothetical protein
LPPLAPTIRVGRRGGADGLREQLPVGHAVGAVSGPSGPSSRTIASICTTPRDHTGADQLAACSEYLYCIETAVGVGVAGELKGALDPLDPSGVVDPVGLGETLEALGTADGSDAVGASEALIRLPPSVQ